MTGQILVNPGMSAFDLTIYQALCKAAEQDVQELTAEDEKTLMRRGFDLDFFNMRSWVTFETLWGILNETLGTVEPYNWHSEGRIGESLYMLGRVYVERKSDGKAVPLICVTDLHHNGRRYAGILKPAIQ